MTDLSYVTLGNVVYVTSAANARVIEKEQADRKGNGGVDSSQYESVAAHSLVFNNRPLTEVMAKLSECGATNILLDARFSAKTKKKVTATFVNHVTFETALRILTDMTDLSYVTVENVVYVTSRENAQRIKGEQPNNEDHAKLQQALNFLEETIETAAFQDATFAKFLAALEAKSPKDAKLSLRIDERAFGTDFPKVSGAVIKFPSFPRRMALATALRMALSKVPSEVVVEYTIDLPGLVITSPQRAEYWSKLTARWKDYEVADVVKEMPLLLPDLKKYSGDVYQNVKGRDGAQLLVRFLMNEVELRPWESIQIRNGVRLSVFASFSRQREIADQIDMLRRLADVAVVMNARLYEVDRAFFTKHVAPLFAKQKDSDERPVVVAIDGPLLERLIAHKHVAESEEIKIRPGTDAAFLSLHSVFRFSGGPVPEKDGRTMTGTGLTGVSFEVRPLVSPDRRHLRLQITQKTAELAGLAKINAQVEAPDLRGTSVTGTAQIMDGVPILMPVDHPPVAKKGEDKVRLLVARPVIWIEEEVKEIKAGHIPATFKSTKAGGFSIWDSEVPKEEVFAPASRLPSSDEVKEILQAVVTDVLTNKQLKSMHESYGTAQDKTFALVDGDKLGWPKEFKPQTHGYKLVPSQPDPFGEQRRVLGIRLDKFDLKQKTSQPFDTPIEVTLFNAGGSANGGAIGACHVYYEPKRVGKRWTVELHSIAAGASRAAPSLSFLGTFFLDIASRGDQYEGRGGRPCGRKTDATFFQSLGVDRRGLRWDCGNRHMACGGERRTLAHRSYGLERRRG